MPIFICGLHQYEQTIHLARNRCSLCTEYPPFAEKMNKLTSELSEQMKKEKALDEEIKTQVLNIGLKLD